MQILQLQTVFYVMKYFEIRLIDLIDFIDLIETLDISDSLFIAQF